MDINNLEERIERIKKRIIEVKIRPYSKWNENLLEDLRSDLDTAQNSLNFAKQKEATNGK